MDDFETLPKMADWSNLVPTSQFKVHEFKPNHNMQFSNNNGVIGTLDFNGPAMVFEGNAEESALLFFDFVSKYFDQRLKDEYQRGYNDAKKEKSV